MGDLKLFRIHNGLRTKPLSPSSRRSHEGEGR